ncbi:MAG: tRNA (adenosine(37)-N6)-threonylcarbamoyltransferase complex ATPase subunit type 1 TsaE [Candidatus Eremiobacteraeota bacterium]|nr:tRNA (adenosine(37)-N6)-threonylcarbamoyltransferase complex ATPase subunit type 1 TsaE [Candidatus Eremiobacteraeota bacterium]
MKTIEIKTNSSDKTLLLGEKIGESLYPGSGILFYGDLGTGKTTLISGICKGLKVKNRVKSPTFVLAWLYDGDIPVYHVDLYRLGDYEELENIGWEEMVDETGIYLVEWADRFELPYTQKAIRIYIDYSENINNRKIVIKFDSTLFEGLNKLFEKT